MPSQFDEDTPLGSEEKREKIALLKATPFEKIKVHNHFYNKFGKPRHGVTLEKAKEIYVQFDKIIDVTKRPGLQSIKYNFLYRINKNFSYSLLFFFDEKPIQLFNAISRGKSIEKRLLRKYFGYSNK